MKCFSCKDNLGRQACQHSMVLFKLILMDEFNLQFTLNVPSKEVLPSTPLRNRILIDLFRSVRQSCNQLKFLCNFALRNNKLAKGEGTTSTVDFKRPISFYNNNDKLKKEDNLLKFPCFVSTYLYKKGSNCITESPDILYL